jgi:hypothetical protein
MKKLYMLFLALTPMLVWGQILTWNFNGAAGNETTVTSTTKDVNLNAGTLSRGSGVVATALANAFSSSTWNVATEALAISGNRYLQFTVSAASGYQVSLSTLDAWFRRSSTGPNAFQWQYSLDGFASTGIDIGTNISYTATTSNGDAQAQINLAGISGLQNIAAGTTITIRLFGWGASAAGGTFALGRPANPASSLSIGGTVTAISGGTTPTIAVAPSSLSGFATVTGTASAAQTFVAGGSNLTNDISISFPPQYEVSRDGGATYTGSSPVTLTQTGGTVANTTIGIRIAASAATGAANGNVTVASTGATSQLVSLTGAVSSGVTVQPLQGFSAVAASTSVINLSGTGNANGDNIVVAANSTASFGTPSGTLLAGNTISGGGTVLYSGPSSSFSFAHTGLTAATQYFYQAWSVDGSNNYSTGMAANATTQAPPAANVVINQVYGGGGNSGSTYKNDFIELYNNEDTPVNLSGWSVQYAAPAGTAWQVHAISGIVSPHSFFLVQEAAGTGGTLNLPTPDATGTLAMGGVNGKVLLSNTTVAQTGANPAGPTIIDKVGYGTANGFEGTGPASSTDHNNTTSVTRVADGVDNNNNPTDFAEAIATPRNGTYTTTAPTVLSLTPPNGAVGIPYTLHLSIVFDKKIVKGTGAITIYENGVAGTPLDVNDAGVIISNNSSVAIPSALTGGKSYYVLISAGAFKDVYNNDFAGISSPTTWAFTTYNDAVAATVPVSYDLQNCSGNGLLPGGFTQYNTTGAQIWDCTSFGRDPAAPAGTTAFPNAVQINGFSNGANNINKDWLISPKLDLAGTAYPLLNFWSRNAFAGDPLELKISTDYTGSGDPALATWTDLNGKFPSKGSDVWTLSSGINLSAFKQSSVYIAFVYSSTTDDGSRWTLDDISLDNSATPPPPSLTLSATNLEYGYTANGSNSTKTITVTGNDLVGDITLTTTGNFQVSTDNINFGSTTTILQAVADNVPQLVYIRFAPAINNVQYNETLSVSISDSTGIVALKGNSIDPASTLNVVNWNLNWFAIPVITGVTDGLGPVNKSLQQDNVATVLKTIPADLFVLQEVVNQHALDSIVNTMPGFAYKINDYGSYSNPTISNPNPLTVVQKLAFVYKTSKFSNIHTDSLLSKGVTLGIDTLNPYYNAFASGRFPYMMTADVTLSDNNGGFITHQMRFINIHGKANTAPVVTAYNRRLAGAKGLDSLIKADYINDNVIILGDFNDDLNQTITAGITPPVSSYSPFTVDDAGLYIFPTKPLSPAGQHSDVNFTSVIDNVVATAVTNKYYLPSSATVLSDVANVVPKYASTTTDHYPVFSQFSFSTAAALPVKLINFSGVKQNELVKLSWSTTQEENSLLFDVERSANGGSFTKIGTVNAQGNSSIKVDYSFNDRQPLTGNNYYRLKQVDKDGKSEYSTIVKVNFSKQPAIRIVPNPASSYVYVSLENITTTAWLQVIDLNGQLLKQQLVNQNSGNTTLSLAGLAKGLYTIKLVSAEKVTTQKLVIQ